MKQPHIGELEALRAVLAICGSWSLLEAERANGATTLLVVYAFAEVLFRLVERPSHRAALRRFPEVVRRTAEPAPGAVPA